MISRFVNKMSKVGSGCLVSGFVFLDGWRELGTFVVELGTWSLMTVGRGL